MAFFLEHVASVLAFSLLVVAPLPFGLCLAALREDETQRRLSLPQALLLLLAAWCLVQALVAHVLGLLHQLRFSDVLVAELLVFVAGALSLTRRRLSGRWAAPTLHEGSPHTVAHRIDALETLTLLALAFMGLTLLWWSAAMPVVDWDSWAFHMPHMAEWLQSGTFTRIAQGAERPRNSYPYGWEALCTLFLTPFGEDMLVTFPNVVAWVLLGLAAYLLARLWRARRIHALSCSACLLAIHYVADPVNTMHVDMPFAALFVTGAYYGASYARSGERMALGLSAAIIGLACATRTTGPFYALLLAAWILGIRAGSERRQSLLKDATQTPVLVGLAAAIVLGAFWYAKNLLEVGHVLGPGAPVAGPESVKGTWAYFAARTLAFTFNPLQPASWKAVMDRSFHELDAPFVAIVAMTALWPIARLSHRSARRNESAVALALLLAGTGVAFYFTPLSTISGIQLRLGLPFLAVLAVAAAVGATRARLHAAIPVAFALVSATRTFSGSRLLFPLMLLAVVWGVWRSREPIIRLSRGRAFAAGGIIVLAVVTATLLARERRERERHAMYGSFYAYLEQQVSPNEPVAYLLSERSYLFYGRHLARSLLYAPLAAEQRVEDWAAPLRERGIRIVAVGPCDGDDAAARTTLDRLRAPAGPLVAVSGSDALGKIQLFRLDTD